MVFNGPPRRVQRNFCASVQVSLFLDVHGTRNGKTIRHTTQTLRFRLFVCSTCARCGYSIKPIGQCIGATMVLPRQEKKFLCIYPCFLNSRKRSLQPRNCTPCTVFLYSFTSWHDYAIARCISLTVIVSVRGMSV